MRFSMQNHLGLNHVERVRRACWLLAPCAAAVLLAAGCLKPPDEIPANLAKVMSARETFTVNAQEPIGAPEGTRVTSVDALTGCWGSAWIAPTGPNDNNPSGLEVYQAIQFDPATGDLVRSIYQVVPLFGVEVSEQRGVLQLDGPDDAVFNVSEVTSTARTGKLTVVQYDTLPQYAVTLMQDGDDLLIEFNEIDTPRTSGGIADGVILRHRAFECATE